MSATPRCELCGKAHWSDDYCEVLDGAWPSCPKPDCDNRVCRWAGTGLCHPHSVSLVGAEEMERRYRDTRAPGNSWSGHIGGLEESGGSSE